MANSRDKRPEDFALGRESIYGTDASNSYGGPPRPSGPWATIWRNVPVIAATAAIVSTVTFGLTAAYSANSQALTSLVQLQQANVLLEQQLKSETARAAALSEVLSALEADCAKATLQSARQLCQGLRDKFGETLNWAPSSTAQ